MRFASVYHNFREAKDFEVVLDELSEEEKAAGGGDEANIGMIGSRPICRAADALMCNP